MARCRLVTGLPRSAGEEDEDVARERERVQRGKAQNDLLRVCDLTKVCFVFFSLALSYMFLTFTFIHSGDALIQSDYN